MRVLVTSATSTLGQLVVDGLSGRYIVVPTERRVSAANAGIALAHLGSDLSTNLLVRGTDAIVHVGEPLPDEDGIGYLDYMTRQTYNLCLAAYQEGVRRVVFLSSLDLMTGYDRADNVTERWRPRSKPEFPEMGKLMGESVVREFAREHKLEAMVLRLGHVQPSRPDQDDCWLSPDDLTRAVGAALDVPAPIWSVLHVQSSYAGARFACGDAEHLLNYQDAADEITHTAQEASR